MKCFLALFGLIVVLAACSPSSKPSTIENFVDCASAGNPVMESYPRQCSANGVTYSEEIDIPIGATACPDPRPLGATKEYIPVLASDNIEYSNWRLACMEESVEWYIVYSDKEQQPSSPLSQICSAEQKNTTACTMEHAPVCAFVDNGIRCVTTPCPSEDAQTFSNACSACTANAHLYYAGACEDQTFVVCDGMIKTGFNPTEYAEDIGGICVDACPRNYDPYTTQIGVVVCIEHFDLEEINAWKTCQKSSDSCNCVKTYDTTRGLAIEDTSYRCVPQSYADRAIFRSGLDRLDENGVKSVMIA